MNAMVAGLAASLAGCATEDLRRGLRSFEPLPHRLQPVGEYDGVLWVNDSKGTNISATRVAVEAFQRPVVVLLGGRHKGESYQALLPVLREHARTVIAFGEAAPRIVGDLTGQVPLTVASSMDDVVGIARQVAEPGDVVLLSPACSSFDMYSNYAARGDAFTEAVRKLFEGNGSS
jgi:UDP-N-acetylmuramoylalanine--D-glutamate ligase